jgi:hypothetical protein
MMSRKFEPLSDAAINAWRERCEVKRHDIVAGIILRLIAEVERYRNAKPARNPGENELDYANRCANEINRQTIRWLKLTIDGRDQTIAKLEAK